MKYDIAIVGGGFVGLTLAHALDKYGFKSIVFDATAPKKRSNESLDKNQDSNNPNINLENRGIALANTSINILSMLNIWQNLQQITPIKSIHISEHGSFGRIKLTAQNYNMEQFGAVVCADALLTTLQESSNNLINTKTLFATKIKSVERHDSIWKIQYATNNDNNSEIQAKLLIAADGANSFVRDFAKIVTTKKDYNKSALVFNAFLEKSHNNIAFERFYNDITLALVPLNENQYKCILILPNNIVQQYKEYPEAQLISELYKIIGTRVGKINKLGTIISYPLIKVVAQELYKEGLVLVGNAANTIMPIAAQGLNLGLRDVATLVEVLYDAKKNAPIPKNVDKNVDKNLDANKNYLNNINLLAKYSELRRGDHARTTNFADNVVKLFDLNIKPVSMLRSFGLAIFGLSRSLQQLIVQEGQGSTNNLPKLSCGIEL